MKNNGEGLHKQLNDWIKNQKPREIFVYSGELLITELNKLLKKQADGLTTKFKKVKVTNKKKRK